MSLNKHKRQRQTGIRRAKQKANNADYTIVNVSSSWEFIVIVQTARGDGLSNVENQFQKRIECPAALLFRNEPIRCVRVER